MPPITRSLLVRAIALRAYLEVFRSLSIDVVISKMFAEYIFPSLRHTLLYGITASKVIAP